MTDKRVSLAEIGRLIPDRATVSISGAWMMVADSVLRACGQSFLETGHPRDITAVFTLCPGGTLDQPGIEYLAEPGLLRRVIGGSFPNIPQSRIRRMIAENGMQAYNLPAGMIAAWYREVGAGRAGALSRRGIGTFADPRIEGGRINSAAQDALLSVVELNGREYLFLPSAPVDVSIIRATTADEAGNLTMEHEPATMTAFVQAAAARASGGKVIAQVKKVVPAGTLNPHHVKVPGTLVDYLVVEPNPLQAAGIGFDASLCGEERRPLTAASAGSTSDLWIARRALRELRDGDVVVLGYGISALVPHLLLEAGKFQKYSFAIEQGSIGGLPLTDFGFGSSVNPQAIFDAATQFDMFQGGCFDQAMLSFLQVDSQGRVNVHKIDSRPGLSAGIGGFVDIAASAPRLIFLGYFTAGGLEVNVSDSQVRIVKEGKMRKFVNRLDHISFDTAHANAREILYITERGVLRRSEGRLALAEVPRGVDVPRDILAQMDFEPSLDRVKVMEVDG